MKGFVVVCEFLHYVLVVAVERAGTGDKLNIVAMDGFQFCVPESIVFSVIIEVEVEGYVVELTVL